MNEEMRKSHISNLEEIETLKTDKSDLELRASHLRSNREHRRQEWERNLPHEVIGREENVSLRVELDQLHRDLSEILEQRQRVQIEEEAGELEKRKSTSRKVGQQRAQEIIRQNGLEEGRQVRETSIIYEQGKEMGRTSQIRNSRLPEREQKMVDRLTSSYI